jgi:hypothetical protein
MGVAVNRRRLVRRLAMRGVMGMTLVAPTLFRIAGRTNWMAARIYTARLVRIVSCPKALPGMRRTPPVSRRVSCRVSGEAV